MRLIDADKMLEDMSKGTAPLVGYVPRDWILEQPTVRPEHYEYVDSERVLELVTRLFSKPWKVLECVYDHKLDSRKYEIVDIWKYKSIQALSKLSKSLFIDPKQLRECLSDIRWVEAKIPDADKILIKDPDFIALVDLAFPDWNTESKNRCLTEPG